MAYETAHPAAAVAVLDRPKPSPSSSRELVRVPAVRARLAPRTDGDSITIIMTHAVVGFGAPGDVLSLIQDAEVDALFAIGWAQLYTGPIPPAAYPVAVSTGPQTLTGVQAQQVRTNLTLDRVVTPEQYRQPTDTDDTNSIVAALAHSSAVQLDDKVYLISGLVTVGPNQTLLGKGGMRVNHGTVLRCTTSSAGLVAVGDAPNVADLTVDGNGVANVGFRWGGLGALDAGSDGVCRGVMVSNCVQQNWYFAGSQNFLVQSCRSQGGAGDGLVLDYSVGGALFERFEAAGAAHYNIHITQSATHVGGYLRVADCVFVKCIAEQSAGDYPQVFVEAAFNVTFQDIAVYCSVAGATSPLIKVTAYGWVRFHNPVMQGQAGQVGIEAAYDPAQSFCKVYVTGILEAFVFTAGLFKTDATSLIIFKGYSPQVAAGTLPLRAAGTSSFNVRDDRLNAEYYLGSATSEVAYVSQARGEAQYRFVRTVDGTMLWGAGTTPGDTDLYRLSAGVLATTHSMLSARRFAPNTTVAPTSGVVTLDASVSDAQAVGVTAAVTSLVINKFDPRQRLQVTFVMGGTVFAFSVASFSGTQADGTTAIASIQWRGGTPPALTTANKAVTCQFVMIGGVLYEMGRLSTDPANP